MIKHSQNFSIFKIFQRKSKRDFLLNFNNCITFQVSFPVLNMKIQIRN